MRNDPILCFSPGACSRVTLIALEEIGEPFQTRLIAFMAGEHRSKEYLAINPSGKVPALILTESTITQNTAILHYLSRCYPGARLLPEASGIAAEALLIAKLARYSADLHPLVTRIVMSHFFTDVEGGPADVRAKASALMALQLAETEAALAEQDWVLGKDWSVLDAYLFWIWFRITCVPFDTKPFPNIARHYEHMTERPAVKRTLAREAEASAELERRGLAVPIKR